MPALAGMAHAPTRILVLASRELAAKITGAFANLPHVECTTLYDDDDDDRREFGSLKELTSVIFPTRHEVTPPFRSFFQWGYYDYVILQDLWLSETVESLEAAGYVLASLDFMRGNFGTKKIVLLSDASFAWWKAVRHRMGKEAVPVPDEEGARQQLVTRFDTKGMWAFVHLTEDARSLQTLRGLIQGDPGERRGNPSGPGLDDISRLDQPVLEATDRALRDYIVAQAEIILVEDDAVDLQRSLGALGGPWVRPEQNAVTIVSVVEEEVRSEDTFESVLASCRTLIDHALENPTRNSIILVVDVLLNVPGLWNRTGIDLLLALRKEYEGRDRLRFVVFTGFSSPPITMAAYQLGADFVVHKGGGAGHGAPAETARRSHEPIVTEALSRLVMTLALMCYQKEFLRGLRTSVTDGTTDPDQAHLFLTTMVPKHAMSLHMRPEWEDTHYLIRCAQVYGRGTRQFDAAKDEIDEKYRVTRKSLKITHPEQRRAAAGDAKDEVNAAHEVAN